MSYRPAWRAVHMCGAAQGTKQGRQYHLPLVQQLRLVADLRRWVGALRAVLDGPGGAREFAALLRYIELAGEAAAPDQLRDFIVTLGPEAEEAYVTIADMLRAEGRVETLIQQLTLKFGPLPQDAVEIVQAASAGQLQVWTARVLTAGTLDEVLH